MEQNSETTESKPEVKKENPYLSEEFRNEQTKLAQELLFQTELNAARQISFANGVAHAMELIQKGEPVILRQQSPDKQPPA